MQSDGIETTEYKNTHGQWVFKNISEDVFLKRVRKAN